MRFNIYTVLQHVLWLLHLLHLKEQVDCLQVINVTAGFSTRDSYSSLEYDDDDYHVVSKRGGLDYGLDGYRMTCKETFEINEDKVINILSPYHGRKQYPGGLECDWEIMGYEDPEKESQCFPAVTCDVVDLRESADHCSLDSLKITDGLLGEKDLCGPNLGFADYFEARSSNYMYIMFKTGDSTAFDRLYKGFACTVRCHSSPRTTGKLNKLPLAVPPKVDSRIVCGRQFDEGKDRIVGGQDAAKREFPWQVAIVGGGTRIPFCGGSLINDRYILTAAHCVLDDEYEMLAAKKVDIILNAHQLIQFRESTSQSVPLGEAGSYQSPGFNLSDVQERNEIIIKSEAIIVHQFYSKFFDYDCDIALIKLEKPVSSVTKESPTPICLPDFRGPENNYEGATSVVSGWGKAHELSRASTKILQKVEVPIIPHGTCEEWYNHTDLQITITSNMLCAGYEQDNKDACGGDSGGPQVLKEGNKWIQIGVVSFGVGCAGYRKPGVYTRVSRFLHWIYHHSKGATWPDSV